MYDAKVAGLRHDFWFICSISNPVRYKSRFSLYNTFRKHITEELGANLLTIECAHGDRGHYVTYPDITQQAPVTCPHTFQTTGKEIHVQVTNDSSMFLKENLLNIGLTHLPANTKYVAWVDADIRFLRPDIVDATIHALQTHRVVSPWRNCIDQGPGGEVMEVHHSFGWCHASGQKYTPPAMAGRYPAPFFHPGFCAAFHFADLREVGGFIEVGILGAGDHHMSSGILGRVEDSVPGNIHPHYTQVLLNWQERAQKVFRRSVGYVEGSIAHSFHGHKVNRGYRSRWNILTEHQYDPLKDVIKNMHGVYEFVEHCTRGWALRDGIHRYMTSRKEDTLV